VLSRRQRAEQYFIDNTQSRSLRKTGGRVHVPVRLDCAPSCCEIDVGGLKDGTEIRSQVGGGGARRYPGELRRQAEQDHRHLPLRRAGAMALVLPQSYSPGSVIRIPTQTEYGRRPYPGGRSEDASFRVARDWPAILRRAPQMIACNMQPAVRNMGPRTWGQVNRALTLRRDHLLNSMRPASSRVETPRCIMIGGAE
jgi:hypothetical protein